MKQLTIDRSKWGCKKKHDACRLLNEENGRMCCLGFVGKALKQDLNTELPESDEWGALWVVDSQASQFSERAARINDNFKISTAKKEKLLIEHFATEGIKLRFKGKL